MIMNVMYIIGALLSSDRNEKMDTIETIRAFTAVAQEGSFTAAARRLGMSTKLASKYVQQLEARLETQLFNRTTRSVALTDVGTAYLERCRPILEQFDELDALVKERQTSLAGPVRITAPTAFGSTKLTQALIPFMLAHREVAIDMKLTDNRVALVEEGFDLAIRVGVLRDSTLIAKKLADMPMIASATVDLPHPLSPVMARVMPRCRSKETWFTALTMPSGVSYSAWRSSTRRMMSCNGRLSGEPPAPQQESEMPPAL